VRRVPVEVAAVPEQQRPRRPYLLAAVPERLAGTVSDPHGEDAAEELARALLAAARTRTDERERLVRLADEVGLDELDAAWRGAEPGTLPAALRVLYLLRAWTDSRPAEVARLLTGGRPHAEVSATVAGVPAYPSPADARRLADDLLRGALARDAATALHRAAAMCRVLAAGRGAQEARDPDHPWADAVLGSRLLTTAENLDTAAHRLRGSEPSRPDPRQDPCS
jgi:hypothetical protein